MFCKCSFIISVLSFSYCFFFQPLDLSFLNCVPASFVFSFLGYAERLACLIVQVQVYLLDDNLQITMNKWALWFRHDRNLSWGWTNITSTLSWVCESLRMTSFFSRVSFPALKTYKGHCYWERDSSSASQAKQVTIYGFFTYLGVYLKRETPQRPLV